MTTATTETVLIRNTVLVLMILLLLGCRSVPRDIETPFGPVPGQVVERLEILGVISRITQTRNRPDGRELFDETLTVEVPIGTHVIIPAVRGWSTGYGATDPEDLSEGTEDFTLRLDERDLGVQHIWLQVERISPPDPAAIPPRQTAEIRVQILLTERDRNRRWFGFVAYNLICLGRAGAE